MNRVPRFYVNPTNWCRWCSQGSGSRGKTKKQIREETQRCRVQSLIRRASHQIQIINRGNHGS